MLGSFDYRCFSPMTNAFFTLVEEQFIYDLPDRLGKCIKSEAYADAVRFYTGAVPILKVVWDWHGLLLSIQFIHLFLFTFFLKMYIFFPTTDTTI